jgi:hypothetical protein
MNGRQIRRTNLAFVIALLALVVALLPIASVASAGAGTAERPAAEPAPVPSLEPAATARLWRKLVAARRDHERVEAGCRPLRGIFYAATDFLRLATKLAASASPCAQYYVSIPPIVGDKTQLRRDQAWRVRALGPNFHALAEIHYATWTKWVANTGSSWYTAGVTARQRMAAAGYDVTRGDSWVVNEASTAVRKGTGNARANLLELLRGLYEGDGSTHARGALFIVGVGQQASDVSLYQTNLQNWLSDSDFWTRAETYVSDWSQEVYGDVRNWAVPGVTTSDRRDHLNDYLQHEIVLAGAGPAPIETARNYLQTAYSPLANAAWERETGYGWTKVPFDLMANYVSAQVAALRFFSSSTSQIQDHWGFAWAPRNASAYSPTDFANKTGFILDRLGAAVRDSADAVDPEDPGSAACGPAGENTWCIGDLEGASLTDAWKSFRVWTQPLLTFASAPQTIPAGTPSSPMSLALTSASGAPITARTALTVTLTSDSAAGTFSTSPDGPWSPTLSLPIARGAGASAAFYYLDTLAGSHLLTAAAVGATSGTQTVTVTPGPLASLAITPRGATARTRSTQRFQVVARDAYGNTVPVSVTWSLAPESLGILTPRSGDTTTFTARRALGRGTVTAAVETESGSLSASAGLRVTPARLELSSITYQGGKRTALITVRVVDVAGHPISRAAVSILVRRAGRLHFAARATTGAAGKARFKVPVRKGGCFVTGVRRVSAAGFVWDGRVPRNHYCRPRST